MGQIARAVTVAAVALASVGAVGFSSGGPAAAEGSVSAMDAWYVAEVFPYTSRAWYDCEMAARRYYKGQCKVDSDNTSLMNLWASRG
jgi:hypothetical protein